MTFFLLVFPISAYILLELYASLLIYWWSAVKCTNKGFNRILLPIFFLSNLARNYDCETDTQRKRETDTDKKLKDLITVKLSVAVVFFVAPC